MYILSHKTQELIAKNYDVPNNTFYELYDFCDSSIDLKNKMKDVILEYFNKSGDIISHDGTVNFEYNEITKQLFKIKKDIHILHDLVNLKPDDLEEIVEGKKYNFEFNNDFLDNFSAEIQNFHLYEDRYPKYDFIINVKNKEVKSLKDVGYISILDVGLTNITLA